MVVNTRAFLRQFPVPPARACKGGTVRIRDKDGAFLFTAAKARRTLLGAARDRITFHADLTRPTIDPEADSSLRPRSRIRGNYSLPAPATAPTGSAR